MSPRSTVTAILAVAIAGCGSSGTASRSSRVAGVTDTIEYAACLRAHGVRTFPDPSTGGGLQIPNDINPAAPAFRTAQRACQSLMPGASGSPGATAQQKEEMVQEARCMRAHGVPGFPDPVSSPPTSFAGVAEAFGRPGAFVVIPVTLNPQAPGFKQAGRALPSARYRVGIVMRARSIVMAVLAGATLAGCGSSHTPHASAANDHAGVKFATCMRTHGVPSFPDPEDAADVQIPTKLMQNPSPAFTSAMAACQYLVPPGGPPVATASQKAAALKFAQCMRRHGVPHYPDPTYQDGAEVPPFIVDPAINPASPAFGAASKTCQSA